MTFASKSKNRWGFSLLEILVSTAILAILIALSFSALQAVIKRANTARCMSNLRQASLIFHGYAQEKNGIVKFLRDGSGDMWFNELKNYANMSDEEAVKILSCPAGKKPVKPFSWYCYGMRLGFLTVPNADDPGWPIIRDAGGNGFYRIPLAAITTPSKFFLMSDSATISGNQTFRIVPPGLYGGGGVSLRHQGRANALFLDGHVESLDAAGLYPLGFREVLDEKNQPLTLTAP